MTDDQELEEIISEIVVTDDDFMYVEEAQGDDYNPGATAKIRLKREPFDGTIIRYLEVTVTPEGNDDGSAKMSFEYEITSSKAGNAKELEQSDEFNEFIGKLLHFIIIRSFQTGEYKIGSDSNDDTEESTL